MFYCVSCLCLVCLHFLFCLFTVSNAIMKFFQWYIFRPNRAILVFNRELPSVCRFNPTHFHLAAHNKFRFIPWKVSNKNAQIRKCVFPALCVYCSGGADTNSGVFQVIVCTERGRSFCAAGEIIINLHKGKQRWRVAGQAQWNPSINTSEHIKNQGNQSISKKI